jgi:hypothetical protein
MGQQKTTSRREIGKLIKLLEAQRAVLEDDDEEAAAAYRG